MTLALLAVSGALPSAARAAGPISFRPAAVYASPVSGWPAAVDLDGDGRLDVVVAGEGGLSLFYGNGDGTFGARIDLPVTGAGAPAAADLNGDGRPDLIVSQGDALLVLLNQGSRGYAPPARYPVGQQPAGIVAEDFNGDGRPDLAVADSGSNDLCVLLNQGDGTFGPPAFYPAGAAPAGLAAADFNSDGRPDLALSNARAGTVSLYLGDGHGGFTVGASYPAGSPYPGALAADDFNGDGPPDLAVAQQYSDSVALLLGPLKGWPGAPGLSGAGQSPQGLAAADLDGDGKLELVVPNAGTDHLTLLKSGGAGGFLPAGRVPAGSSRLHAVAVGDFNGDSLPDIVTTSESDARLTVLINTTPLPTPALRSLTLAPGTVIGGCQNVTGIITLTVPAPPGGAVVALTSGGGAVNLPPSVTVPAGALSAAFVPVIAGLASPQWAVATASFNGTARRAALLVLPMGPPQLTLARDTVVGGTGITGQITLPCAAGPGGVAVHLQSNSSSVDVPASVTVPAGAATQTFPILTFKVAAPVAARIAADAPGGTVTAALQVLPPPAPPPTPPILPAVQLALFPNPVPGGTLALGQVTLPQPAGPDGVVVRLVSDNPAVAAVPAGAVVLPGARVATFPIITSPVADPTSVLLRAESSSEVVLAELRVLPAPATPPALPAAPPAIPSALSGYALSPTQVMLSWRDTSNNETAFAIWRRDRQHDWAQAGAAAPNATTYADSGLTPGTVYNYRVRAINNTAASDWSNTVTVRTPGGL